MNRKQAEGLNVKLQRNLQQVESRVAELLAMNQSTPFENSLKSPGTLFLPFH